MSREERRRRAAAPFALDLHLDPRELVEDLCWPGQPPGRWLEDVKRPAELVDGDPIEAPREHVAAPR